MNQTEQTTENLCTGKTIFTNNPIDNYTSYTSDPFFSKNNEYNIFRRRYLKTNRSDPFHDSLVGPYEHIAGILFAVPPPVV